MPGSSRSSSRSRAFSTPSARRFSSLAGPPMPSAWSLRAA
ncbi:Uncharacterised protein [Bordetella pertussis]|nr:Uncharacterised protein [Bordetella pertussis]